MNKAIYRLLRIFGTLALMLTAFHSVHALPLLDGEVYYVSPAGNDNAPGTQNQPWRTIQKAANTMPAGSTAIVLAGNYPERVRVQRPSLTFQAQGDVTGQGFVIQADRITIRGFTLTNWGQSYTTGNGAYVANAGQCVIENNRFLYNIWGGVQLADTSHDCIVRNNIFFRNGMFAAEVMGSNHLIENNDVSHVIQRHPCSTSTASWLDSDGFRFHGNGHIFRGNYVHDMPFGKEGYNKTACNVQELANLANDYVSNSHMDCFQTYGGDHVAASNILFDGNRCDLPPASDWIGGAAKMFQGTQGTHHLTFINNLGIVDFIGEFENANTISFTHNTFIGSGHLHSQGIQFYDTTGVYVHYNVFYNQANGIGHLWPIRSTLDEGDNSVYRMGGAPKRAAAPGDLWNINPMLDGNYRPLPGSPLCLPNLQYIGAFPCSLAVTPTFTALPPTATNTVTPTFTAIPPVVTDTVAPTSTTLPSLATGVVVPTFTAIPPLATGTVTQTPSNTPAATIVMPTNVNVGQTASAIVNLNGVPAEGYKSAEFTCTYDPTLVKISNIVVSDLFGADPVVALVNPQNGSFIVAVAGSQSRMATASGPAFTFDLTSLQAGQFAIGCQTRVSKGDNIFIEVATANAPLTILGASTTSIPSPAIASSNLAGQVLATKAVTISLYNPEGVAVVETKTNSDGIFSLTAPPGVYTVVATANGFLSAQGQAALTAGETSIKLPITLIAGDVDGNNVIDQYDAMTIAMNYHTALFEAADLNADGIIDIGDLEVLSFNYRAAGALNWP